MKKKRIMLTCVVMVWAILVGQFHIKASEIGENENKEAALDTVAIEVQESSEDEEELIDLYYQGLLYYLDRYQNESEIVYLQACLEYAGIEEEISREMYDMGKLTAAELKSYEARLTLIKAQLTAAENQKAYNDLFLKEHGLDYSDYIVKEKRMLRAKNIT